MAKTGVKLWTLRIDQIVLHYGLHVHETPKGQKHNLKQGIIPHPCITWLCWDVSALPAEVAKTPNTLPKSQSKFLVAFHCITTKPSWFILTPSLPFCFLSQEHQTEPRTPYQADPRADRPLRSPRSETDPLRGVNFCPPADRASRSFL